MSTATDQAAAPAVPSGAEGEERRAERERLEVLALLASIFLVAACGLTYELLIATVSSYLLGSSVTQFSLSVGMFVGSMGLGSWLSQQIHRGLLRMFIALELVLAAVGGISATVLFWSYAHGALYWVVLIGSLVSIGTLVGVELPLLVRVLNRYGQLRTIVAQALSFDYLGCLAASVLFPLVLLPALGQTRTAFLVGLVNVGVAAFTAHTFRHRIRATPILALCAALAIALGAGFAHSLRLAAFLERRLYDDEVIYARQTPYQRIVVTRWRDDVRLFLDGNLQFSTVDEHRYHESLVHPAMSLAANRESVLVLGGGDGLGVREVLRHGDVRQVTLVDLDPAMVELGRSFPAVREANRSALHDPRVRVVTVDAHRFLETTADRYGVIIADLPDPNGEALARLYSVEFFRLARRHLARGGVFATQGTSPFFSRDAFWCIVRTMRRAGFQVTPTHAYVPSFGDWGFILGAERPLRLEGCPLPKGLRFLTPELLPRLALFEADTAEAGVVGVVPSTVDHPVVLRYYLNDSRRWE